MKNVNEDKINSEIRSLVSRRIERMRAARLSVIKILGAVPPEQGWTSSLIAKARAERQDSTREHTEYRLNLRFSWQRGNYLLQIVKLNVLSEINYWPDAHEVLETRASDKIEHILVSWENTLAMLAATASFGTVAVTWFEDSVTRGMDSAEVNL